MPLADVSLPKVRSLFETNVFSAMAVTNAMLPQLLASKGLIVNISSAADRTPFPFKGTYAMTKAALSSYSRTLSVELAEFDVRVLNVVTSSFVATLIGKRAEPDPWPENSLCDSMRVAGQGVGDGQRLSAEDFATGVAAEALRGKGWEFGPWRFFGTQESMRLGGMSTFLWILGFLSEGWARFVMLRLWPFWMLRDGIRAQKKND